MALSRRQFQQLVEDHGPALYRLAYRLVGDVHEAEDVVQETFRAVWRCRARFDASRSQRAWLVAILRRRVADHWRARARRDWVTGIELPEEPVWSPEPGSQQFGDEIQHALEQLPEQLRETLLLVVVGELTHQQAAQVLGVPLGTVLSRVARARTRLRKLLQDKRDSLIS